ncbi:MAG: zonular occludens toxin domain-containing protein [Methylococcaceae bacterium]|nr:zonular occludens toxin domain-containing protein [Methylococcaceae bacterium]MDP3903549.1 zonular occludens toxin domain-containing protein [Methylococcaceae bacterium]
MIIFHEGLPGSGKSYEAAINQIIPALMKGRSVYAYIEGLNRPKFAEITGIPLELVTKLLNPLTKEQVSDVQAHVANDSLVILDELQDFFPAGKTHLSPGITEFVTQHRHRGIDIVCMGQDHRDCHMLWKRRIDTLIKFLKRDAIGFPNSYTWSTFKQTNGTFTKLRSGSGNYDPKYFLIS